MKNSKKILLLVSLLGALAVILGAFGAHGLKEVLPEQSLSSYNTGIRYHFYHVLVLFGLSILLKDKYNKWFYYASISLVVGIVLFSGSIYLLATKDAIGLTHYKWLGPITPIGGVFFIVAWLLIGLGAMKSNDN